MYSIRSFNNLHYLIIILNFNVSIELFSQNGCHGEINLKISAQVKPKHYPGVTLHKWCPVIVQVTSSESTSEPSGHLLAGVGQS